MILNEVSGDSSEKLSDKADVIGSFRTFGETGPMYEVLSVASLEKVRIEVIHSGEMLEYPLEEVVQDPVAL